MKQGTLAVAEAARLARPVLITEAPVPNITAVPCVFRGEDAATGKTDQYNPATV